MPDNPIQVQCFGKFSITRNFHPVPIPCAKAKELLSLLILENGGPLSKRHVASTLWPDSSETHARDCLYKMLRQLKQSPEISAIFGLHIERNSLFACLDNLQIDLVEFNRCYARRDDISCCERAIELYQGPVFWKEYYDWIDEWQSYYEIRYSFLIRHIAAHYERQGDLTRRDNYLHLADALIPIL